MGGFRALPRRLAEGGPGILGAKGVCPREGGRIVSKPNCNMSRQTNAGMEMRTTSILVIRIFQELSSQDESAI